MPAASTPPAFRHDLGPLIVRASPSCIDKKFYDVEAADGPGCLARTFLSNNPEAEAWATLFAAAPDLLEAARDAALAIKRMDGVVGNVEERANPWNDTLRQLRAAIAKATGAAS